MASTKKNRLTHRALATAVVGALFAPLGAMAQQVVADGDSSNKTVNLDPGTYAFQGASTLSAIHGGYLGAKGGVIVQNGAASGIGALADGAQSTINLQGGSVTTTGDNSRALMARAGGSVDLGRDASGQGTVVASSGAGSISAGAQGAGSSLILTAANIGNQRGSAGVQVLDGASASLTDTLVSLQGSGTTVYALEAGGAGSALRVNGGKISATGNYAKGVFLYKGATADLANTEISTTGNNASGIDIDPQGQAQPAASTLTANRIKVSTTGANAAALDIEAPATIALTDSALSTQGNGAQGINNHEGVVMMNGGSVTTRGDNAHALYTSSRVAAPVSLSTSGTTIATHGVGSAGAYGVNGGSMLLQNSTIITGGDSAIGVISYDSAPSPGSSRTVVHADGTSVSTQGKEAHGAYAYGTNASLQFDHGVIQTSGAEAHGIAAIGGATVATTGTTIHTQGAGSWGVAVLGSKFNMQGGSLISDQDAAILISSSGSEVNIQGQPGQAPTQVHGNGVLALLDSSENGASAINFSQNVVATGDINALPSDQPAKLAALAVSLSDGATWTGATQILDILRVREGGTWNMTADSSMDALSMRGGTVVFGEPQGDAYKTLHVRGGYEGTGGTIVMHTQLNDGGALVNQHTDRLLIDGDVSNKGTTVLDVRGNGAGALTDLNHNGIADAGEGISLVQVGGSSRADAFALKGGYVAAGGLQYRLYAYGPGQADASQNLLKDKALNWDYRLANLYADTGTPVDPGKPVDPGHPVDPTDPVTPIDPVGPTDPADPGTPGDGGTGPVAPPHLAVAPQVPSYLVAPTALFNYGDQTISTLHQRLGEIRQVPAKDDGHGGEVFVRYIGSQQRYRDGRGMANYGYDFDQQINALQLGGSLLTWTGDTSSLRFGWAADQGTTRVTPHAYAEEGQSYGKYTAHGFSAWATWQQNNGFYTDVVVGGERFSGDIGTNMRGTDMARVHASSWTASVEAGYPFVVGGGWSIEPQAQLKYQHLNVGSIDDTDGQTTHIAPSGQTTARIGARFVKTDNVRFAPYARVDVLRTTGGTAKVSVEGMGLANTWQSGRVGNSYRVGVGATSALVRNLSLYGEADYLHGTSSNGFKGWAANVGLRLDF